MKRRDFFTMIAGAIGLSVSPSRSKPGRAIRPNGLLFEALSRQTLMTAGMSVKSAEAFKRRMHAIDHRMLIQHRESLQK